MDFWIQGDPDGRRVGGGGAQRWGIGRRPAVGGADGGGALGGGPLDESASGDVGHAVEPQKAAGIGGLAHPGAADEHRLHARPVLHGPP